MHRNSSIALYSAAAAWLRHTAKMLLGLVMILIALCVIIEGRTTHGRKWRGEGGCQSSSLVTGQVVSNSCCKELYNMSQILTVFIPFWQPDKSCE